MPVIRCWCLPSRCRLLVFRKLRERHKKTTDEDGLPPATPAAECAIALVVVESLRNSFCRWRHGTGFAAIAHWLQWQDVSGVARASASTLSEARLGGAVRIATCPVEVLAGTVRRVHWISFAYVRTDVAGEQTPMSQSVVETVFKRTWPARVCS